MVIRLLIQIISGFLAVIFNITAIFGGLPVPSKDDPIKFKDSENCNMSFVAFADTHLRDTSFQPYYFSCGLKDIDSAQNKVDALLIAGDISEMSDPMSYEVTWEALDNSNIGNEKVILATGNHDIRLAYEYMTKTIMDKNESYLGIEIDKEYFSYDLNGYTFVVLGTDTWQLEKATVSEEQLSFLDSELARATAQGKPAFVVCHQPLDNTHGLPEVWKNGGLGKDSENVKAVLMKHKNVFYLNGHLHDGVYENSLEIFDEENGVYSINLPAFGKTNDYGEHGQMGLGAVVEVYDDEVVFSSRDFIAGKYLEGYTYTFTLK